MERKERKRKKVGRKVRADLHNHLRTSSNMRNFNRVIDVASRRLGPGGVLGVVNYEDERYEQFSELSGYDRQPLGGGFYVHEKDIFVVKGQEVPTKQGEVLVLALPSGVHLRNHQALEYTFSEAKYCYPQGIVGAVHPFYKAGIGAYLEENPGLLRELGFLETHNGSASIFRGVNKKAEAFFERIKEEYPDIGSLVTSDGHSLYEIGSAYMLIDPLIRGNGVLFRDSLMEGIKKKRPPEEEK